VLLLQFVAVQNSKKAKLRQLKDKIAAHESSDKSPKEEDDYNSTDQTGPFEIRASRQAAAISIAPPRSKLTAGLMKSWTLRGNAEPS
jgi:hypothetical protein